MKRPVPTLAYHFTRVEHLATAIEHGLVSDARAKAMGLIRTEIGNREIKERRAHRSVPIHPGGVVADYVPFYFAPRSPMLYSIHKGNVPTYAGGQDDLIYLVTSLEALWGRDLDLVVSDRNAVLAYAEFVADQESIDDLVDWPLMKEVIWRDTPEDPARVERRMAETLVHGAVPFDCMLGVAARSELTLSAVKRTLEAHQVNLPAVVRAQWYF